MIDEIQMYDQPKPYTPLKFGSKSPRKNDGWKMILSFWDGLFSGQSC